MKFISILSVFIFLFSAIHGNPSCPTSEPGMLTVHLVCHTHDDVGWLKTVDQYFYGANNTIQRAGVQYILDSVIDELFKDRRRMFSYVETAFFYRWWRQQTPDMQNKVKGLVASGQLELVGGGWSMNDEAAAHYNAIIDQMTEGLRFLNDTFGPSAHPRVAWQIDPFGHSSAQASIFAQMGFDGLFFGRLDYADKHKRFDEKNMEVVWQPSKSLGEAAWLFTGALPNGYNPPDGFCFDDLCADPPIMDDPTLKDYNVDERVDAFLKAVEEEAAGYRSNHIIMTMGSDFMYQNARTWYKNLDKLIKYVNARQASGSKVNVTYSTPSCYLDGLHSDGLSWNTKQDDFFPYASDPHAYWTGYFTSRPAFKGLVRKSNAYFQALKQNEVIRGQPQVQGNDFMAEAMGVSQHHDAITGTAKQHVNDDYVQRLTTASHTNFMKLAKNIRELHSRVNDELPEVAISFCPERNISACEFTESRSSFDVYVYNSIARPHDKYIRIPVAPDTLYTVTNYKNETVESQLVPIPSAVLKIHYRDSTATHELVFLAKDVPPVGISLYHVASSSSRDVAKSALSSIRTPNVDRDTVVQHGSMSVTIDGISGHLKQISHLTIDGLKTHNVTVEMMYYLGMAGNNTKFNRRASGAYIFRPNGTKAYPLGEPLSTIVQGPLVTEVQQSWGSWGMLVLRLYKGMYHVEVDWMVGPIPVKGDGAGKEAIIRYSFKDVTNEGTFYTDANGRELQKRVLNHRDTWELNVTEPVSGNYYPVTSKMVIHSTNGMGNVSLLNDRAQGGSSLSDGELELMVHRRLLFDDAFGVGEPLNETEFGQGLIVRGTHLLLHSDFSTADCDFACHHHILAEEMMMEAIVMYQESGQSIDQPPFSGLSGALPKQVHLLTLSPTPTVNSIIVRLEHMFEAGESANYSTPVTVNIENLLSHWRAVRMVETVLSGSLYLSESKRLKWTVASSPEEIKASDTRLRLKNIRATKNMAYRDMVAMIQERVAGKQAMDMRHLLREVGPECGNEVLCHEDYTQDSVSSFDVTLQPMQIRTFIVDVVFKQ